MLYMTDASSPKKNSHCPGQFNFKIRCFYRNTEIRKEENVAFSLCCFQVLKRCHKKGNYTNTCTDLIKIATLLNIVKFVKLRPYLTRALTSPWEVFAFLSFGWGSVFRYTISRIVLQYIALRGLIVSVLKALLFLCCSWAFQCPPPP